MVAVLATAVAGEGGFSPQGAVRRIPAEVVFCIKEKAMADFPSQPGRQVEAVTEGVEAWFALRQIPNNPAKRRAAEDFPCDYPKQLYLAQRGF